MSYHNSNSMGSSNHTYAMDPSLHGWGTSMQRMTTVAKIITTEQKLGSNIREDKKGWLERRDARGINEQERLLSLLWLTEV